MKRAISCLLAAQFLFIHVTFAYEDIVIPHTTKEIDIDFVLFDVNLVNAYNDNSIHLAPYANVHVKLLSLINKEMGVSNQVIHTPLLRVMRHLESSQPTCAPAKIKTTERDRAFIFSTPTGLTLSPRLFSKEDIAVSHPQIFNKQKRLINLNELKQVNPRFKLLYSSSKSYDDDLNAQLKAITPKNIGGIASSHTFETVAELFFGNRAEFLLSAPVALLRSFYEESQSLYSYEIQGQQPYFVGHLMCNDFPETREYIKSFDQHLLKLYQNGTFKDLLVKSHQPSFGHQIAKFVDKCLEDGQCLN